MKRATLFVGLVSSSVALAAGFAAIVVNGNAARRTIRAGGRDVTVNGNRNDLHVTGAVPRLTVAGNGNNIRIERVGAIDVPGNRNMIEWAGSPNKRPKITNLGTGNTIIQRKW